MNRRCVGARVNFHFNIEEIQQWKICFIYSAYVSFQCMGDLFIARYENEIKIEIEIENQKNKIS